MKNSPITNTGKSRNNFSTDKLVNICEHSASDRTPSSNFDITCECEYMYDNLPPLSHNYSNDSSILTTTNNTINDLHFHGDGENMEGDKSFDVNDEVFGQVSISNLRTIRIKNMHKLVLAHININSIRNKLTFLKEFINGDVDILLISETKINETFPT